MEFDNTNELNLSRNSKMVYRKNVATILFLERMRLLCVSGEWQGKNGVIREWQGKENAFAYRRVFY